MKFYLSFHDLSEVITIMCQTRYDIEFSLETQAGEMVVAAGRAVIGLIRTAITGIQVLVADVPVHGDVRLE